VVRGQGTSRPVQRHRHPKRRFPSPTRAFSPTCFARARAWWPKARSTAAGTFEADSVLAKHDENYMPKEVADALKAAGVWQHE
jgi:cytochrome c-type biogenesis protein CcmE